MLQICVGIGHPARHGRESRKPEPADKTAVRVAAEYSHGKERFVGTADLSERRSARTLLLFAVQQPHSLRRRSQLFIAHA